MLRLGIATGADLSERSLTFRQQHFGKAGASYYGIARGIDHRPVRADRVRKSVGAENTFATDLAEYEPMREALQPILDKVWRHCDVTGTRGRTVTLKVKFSDFTTITRSRSVPATVESRDELGGSASAAAGRDAVAAQRQAAWRQFVFAHRVDRRKAADDVRRVNERSRPCR